VWNDAVGYHDDASMCGYGFSLDGGATWIDGGELPEPATREIRGDPSIVVTNDGLFVVASVDEGWDDGVAVHRGAPHTTGPDGGIAWEPPRLYSRGGGEALDKPWIAYDAALDRLYLAYVNWSQNRGELAWSEDRGDTWSEPLVVFESSRASGYQPVAGPGGVVDVVWTERLGQPNGSIYARRAIDGAWVSIPNVVTELGGESHLPPIGYNRTVNATFASAAIDWSMGPFRSRIYVAWTDGGPSRFGSWLSASDDGASWSTPRRIDAGTNAFWPRLAVGDDGRVTAAWHDRRAVALRPDLTNVFVAQSLDGGQTFGTNRRMSDRAVSWLDVPADLVPNFGDYLGLSVDGNATTAAWSDARHGDPDVLAARWVERITISVDGAGGGVWWALGDRIEWASSLTWPESGYAVPLVSLGVGLLGHPPDVPGLWTSTGTFDINLVLSDAASTVEIAVAMDIGYPFNSHTIDLSYELDRIGLSVEPADWAGELWIEPTQRGANVAGFVDLIVANLVHRYSLSGTLTTPTDTPVVPLHVKQSGRRPAGTAIVTTHICGDPAPTTSANSPEKDGPPRALAAATLVIVPNPAAPSAPVEVEFDLSNPITGTLRLFDAAGRLACVVREGRFSAGTQRIRFDAVDGKGRPLALGVYAAELEGEGVRATGRLVVTP
jgi:hypothetical protein